MPKNSKKSPKRNAMKKETVKKTEPKKTVKQRKTFKEAFNESRDKVWAKKNARLKLHHSFRRSYREDYIRPLDVPGMVSHAMSTLKIVFRNWKLFFGLLVIIVISNIIFVGLMNQATYESAQESLEVSNEALGHGELGRMAEAAMMVVTTVTTGGLSNNMTEVQQAFAIFLFAITWLVTIYFLRQLMAGNKPKLRDGLFNALTPLISSLCTILLVIIHALPAMLFVVLYSSAESTGFLTQPLYAFLFWTFGGLLILLSCYLLPGSILALVAVSVPGIYPMTAINATTDLIQGRRMAFILRLIFAVIFIAVIWVVIMFPLTWLDMFLRDKVGLPDIPIMPFMIQVMTTFSVIYLTSYIYLFYRRMLDDEH